MAVNTPLKVPGYCFSLDLSESWVSMPWSEPGAGTSRCLVHTGAKELDVQPLKYFHQHLLRFSMTLGVRLRSPMAQIRKHRLKS